MCTYNARSSVAFGDSVGVVLAHAFDLERGEQLGRKEARTLFHAKE